MEIKPKDVEPSWGTDPLPTFNLQWVYADMRYGSRYLNDEKEVIDHMRRVIRYALSQSERVTDLASALESLDNISVSFYLYKLNDKQTYVRVALPEVTL